MKVIDGKNQVLGRIASKAAKLALQGEEVKIINAQDMVISGKLPYLINKYLERRQRKDKANPEHSQHWPRRPDLFVKRIIRGMLPDDTSRGKLAHERIMAYIGVPDEFKKEEQLVVPGADGSKLHCKYCTIKELCTELGHRKA